MNQMKKNIIILNYTVKIKTNNEETTHNTSTNNFLIDKYETNVEYEVKVRASKDGCLGDWSEIIKFKIVDDFEDNKNIFLSSDIFKLKKDDNTNKKNNIFSEIPNQTKSIFGLLDNKIQNPFLNNDSPEKKLFSSNIEKNKQESLFVNNNNNLKTEILGNSNKEQKEENNIKESLFKFDNIFQKKSLFGNINNEKEEINAKKNSIFGIIFNNENSLFKNNDNNKKLSIFSDINPDQDLKNNNYNNENNNTKKEQIKTNIINNNINTNLIEKKEYNDKIVYIDYILDEMNKYISTDLDHRFPLYKIRATVTHLEHTEKNLYPGCPNRECCRPLIFAKGDWICRTCRQSFKNPRYYYSLNIRVKDCSSEYWVDIFGKPALMIMNINADNYRNILVNRDEEKLRQISEGVEYKEFYFLLRVRFYKYNDDITKKKFTATKIEKINKKENTGRLINDIKMKFGIK